MIINRSPRVVVYVNAFDTNALFEAGLASASFLCKWLVKSPRQSPRRPTSAMSKPFLCCERAFCCSVGPMKTTTTKSTKKSMKTITRKPTKTTTTKP